MRGLPYTGLLCLLLCVYQTHGQMTATAFDDANKLYEQGKFPEAAAAYQKLLNSGRGSTAVFFNLGNAFFKAGQIGRAIVAYRQAELLSPRDSDLRANLQFARNQVQGPTVIPNRRAQWLAHLTINEWSWLAAGALWMWFALLTVGQFRPPLRPVLRNYVLLLGTATGVLSACRQAPIDEAQSAFTVHDGAELQILDRKDDWFQVTTDPRRIGWLRRDQVLVP
jgi:tetratricopeptide (TPR) repeat protein